MTDLPAFLEQLGDDEVLRIQGLFLQLKRDCLVMVKSNPDKYSPQEVEEFQKFFDDTAVHVIPTSSVLPDLNGGLS
jgi:hypothetical protein